MRVILIFLAAAPTAAYTPHHLRPALRHRAADAESLRSGAQLSTRRRAAEDDDDPELLLAKAEFLRQEAAYLEASMPKSENFGRPEQEESREPSLAGKTVVVTGANGIVGSVVTEELLRRGCTVRAIVRSAEDKGAYERLSYAVGAESLQGEIEAPWILRDTSEGGPLFNSPAIYAAPEDDSLADTSDEAYAGLTPYAQNQVVAARAARKLRKLEIRSADLRNEKECTGVAFGADAVIYCAASLKPDGARSRGDDAGGRLLEEAGRLFELRLPQFDRVKAASEGEGAADVEGVEFLAKALAKNLSRDRPKPDRPLAFILLSGRSTAGAAAFVERKRESEAALARVATDADWSGSLIARLPPIDAFGYDAGARLERASTDAVAPTGALFPPALAGAISKANATPRDVARCVADALVDAELREGLGVTDLVIDG